MDFGASVDAGRIFDGTLQALESNKRSIWEEGETFYDMRNKIVRRLPPESGPVLCHNNAYGLDV